MLTHSQRIDIACKSAEKARVEDHDETWSDFKSDGLSLLDAVNPDSPDKTTAVFLAALLSEIVRLRDRVYALEHAEDNPHDVGLSRRR